MTLKLDGTGSITGIDQGLNVVGVVTYSTDLNVGGDLNVTGVLTYDDVTNIDSIGVITARSGVYVSGIATFGSSVGIGTDTPAYTLDLGEESSTIRLVSENNGTAIRIGAGGNGSTDVSLLRIDGASDQHDGESDNNAYGFSIKYMGSRSGNNNSLSIFGDNSAGVFNTDPVEAITILQDGKIGIGSAAPTYTLDINAGASSGMKIGVGTHSYRVRANVSSDNDFGFYIEDNEGNDLYNARGKDATSSSNTHRWYTTPSGSTVERLRIASAGQIGLGGPNYGTDNQVITSTGSGSAPEWRGVNAAFYGRQDAQHNIDHATWTVVKNFASDVVNTITGWSESTGIFTANADTAGTYYVFGSAGIDDVQSLDVMRVGISKNNETPGAFVEYRSYSGSANQITGGIMAARVVTLADGDTVRLKVYHNEGTTEPTEPNRTFFGGFRLSV